MAAPRCRSGAGTTNLAMAVPQARTRTTALNPHRTWLPACLAVLAIGTAACAEPPPPAAEYPLAAPPVGPGGAPPILPTEANCGLVKRAKRTWVGFGPGMTLDDMVPAGVAAGAIVRALDAAVCAVVQRGQSVALLQRHGPQLKAQAADGGGFEVTQVLWQDAELTHARVELRGLRGSASFGWLARLARQDAIWKLEAFARQVR
jgi:hypothetical protein